MAVNYISDHVKIQNRYVRAVDLARDLHDPDSLYGYVVTPNVHDALRRILNGLKPDSTLRAFRVTGPYGSGKSAFGLSLAGLLGDPKKENQASQFYKDKFDLRQIPYFEPIVLVGYRTSLSDEILIKAIETGSSLLGKSNIVVNEIAKYQSSHSNQKKDPVAVLDLLVKLSDQMRLKKQCGLIVLIDEMGRFLEYSAANPDKEDPSIFQLLAERAGGSKNKNLAVVGFLHHRFGDYVATLGNWIEGEWSRSSERYEEISFQENSEQTLYLVSQALQPIKMHDKKIIDTSEKNFREAIKRRLIAEETLDEGINISSLYPLHPATLTCLFSTTRRFGQSGRSVFSFLQSSEPYGFQRFINENKYDSLIWYRIHNLYDYLSSQGEFRFKSNERENRWQLAKDILLSNTDMSNDEVLLLKSIAILSVLEPIPGLKSDIDTLKWALEIPKVTVTETICKLEDRGVIHKRSTSSDYSLWSHTSIDLDHWRTEAKLAVPKVTNLDNLYTNLPPIRPLIAQSHYQKTGTLRSFAICFEDQESDNGIIGEGKIIIKTMLPDEPFEKEKENAAKLSKKLGNLVIVRLHQLSPELLNNSYELSCWKWILENCPELRMDDIARAEVDTRIRENENLIGNSLSPYLELSESGSRDSWFYMGKEIKDIKSRSTLNANLSKICDEVYSDAPILKNELINRSKLSAPVSAARMKLMDLMLSNGHLPYLGMDQGAPPELTIYRSMFLSSGIHQNENKNWYFAMPLKPDRNKWSPAWNYIDSQVKGSDKVTISNVMEGLQLPPFGLKNGAALLLVIAYIVSSKNSIALMEKNSFQPAITHAHLMRLAKAPKYFELHHIPETFDNTILNKLVESLEIWVDNPPTPLLIPVVESLFNWWNNLSQYTKNTRTVNKTAQSVREILRKADNPISLVFEQLPNACGAIKGNKIDTEIFVTSLNLALNELSGSYSVLIAQARKRLLSAFGVSTISKLRSQIKADYEEHILQLADYDLRAFVDRALNNELTDDVWLDRIGGLVVGKRLDSWDDSHLDLFGFEIRQFAQNLARRLATIRETISRKSPVTAIHLTDSNGKNGSLFVHDNKVEDIKLFNELKKLLADSNQPDIMLVKLFESAIKTSQREKVE